MHFEWDDRKDEANIAKHGVSFEKAQQAFADPRAVVAFDPEHSTATELRWWLLGKVNDRVLLVRYTHRPVGVVRIIGAGYWRIAKERYERTQQK